MYRVSTQGVKERIINLHNYYYYYTHTGLYCIELSNCPFWFGAIRVTQNADCHFRPL